MKLHTKQPRRQPSAAHKTGALVCSNVIRHEKSIFLMRDAQSPWRDGTLLDRAKEEYALRLLQGVGKVPVLPKTAGAS